MMKIESTPKGLCLPEPKYKVLKRVSLRGVLIEKTLD